MANDDGKHMIVGLDIGTSKWSRWWEKLTLTEASKSWGLAHIPPGV